MKILIEETMDDGFEAKYDDSDITCPIGHGKTMEEAINDLKQKFDYWKEFNNVPRPE